MIGFLERMCLLCDFHHAFIGKGWELSRGPGGHAFVRRTPSPEAIIANHDPPPF